MARAELPKPKEVVAVDWGATPAKRQRCRAVLRGGRYEVLPPEPVRDAKTLELPAHSLIAFDCVLGLPAGWARDVGITGFREGLGRFGAGEFDKFYEPASTPGEIALTRPFYPAKATGAKREELRRVLGDEGLGLRGCDRATGAGPLFWLVGAKQVGRSSITVWRDVLAPRLGDIALWPFDGSLSRLLFEGKPVVAEMYPAFLARALGLTVAKRDQASRAAAGAMVLAKALPMIDTFHVRELLREGFGASASGEDAFDATIACIGLTHLVLESRIPEPPAEGRNVEGWILAL